MAKILVVGDIYLETQYFVDDIPKAKGFEVAKHITNIAGSKMLNAAEVFIRSGHSVDFYGKVGDDKLAESILNLLSVRGIHSNYVKRVTNEKSGQLVVITNNSGESAINLSFGVNQEFNSADIKELSLNISEYDYVYAGTNLPLNFLYDLIDLCNARHIPIFVDVPNQHDQIDVEKLMKATYVAPNRQEAEMLFGKELKSKNDANSLLIELKEKYDNNILISLDEEGAIISTSKNDIIYKPAGEVDVLDTTGAGDILRGVFVGNLLDGLDIQDALNNAVMFATSSVQVKGVLESISYCARTK